MNIDHLDIKILKEFDKLEEGEKITRWKMMRRIFPKGRHNQETLLRNRFNKLLTMGLFTVEINSPKTYYMITNNVIFKKIKFPDKKIHNAACLKINGYWEIFQL